MNYENIKQNLSKILEGDVTIDNAELTSHSTDWSLFKIMPDMVVYPKHAQDLEQLVSFVNDYNNNSHEKLSLTARAAGSGMSGGSLNHSIIVDVTKYMNAIGEVTIGDFGSQSVRGNFSYPITGYATVEPGSKYIPFEEQTMEHNMLMPTFPASRKLCAIGGMVANNGAGEKSLKYGQNKDFVQSLKVILADGNEYTLEPMNYDQLRKLISKKHFYAQIAGEMYELVKKNFDLIQSKKPTTSKNSAGYLIWDALQAKSIEDFENGNGFFDMTKLIVGAQGTTGIISEVTYKLTEHEDKEEMIVSFVNDIHQLPKIVEVLKKHDLDTIELYDDNTFKIGVKFFADFIKDKGFFQAIKYSVRFLPEFWMAITGGVPKFVVLAESADNDAEKVHQEVLAEFEDLKKEIPDLKSFVVKGKESQKYWDFRHDSFKLLTEHSMKTRKEGSGTRTAPFIDDIAVNPEHLPEYIPRLVEMLEPYKGEFMYTIAGHLGNGNFHIIPLVDMNKQQNKDHIVEISEKVYDLALEYNGSITAEHNDGIVRTPFLPQMFGEDMMTVFKKIKDIMDPHNIFNPGKKIGMTKEDIHKYLA
ncbi:MAG: FAD-binding oxidoreductase [Candidatus Pacebacteria bacterium]|nr:FAD-binding oxidoreductase [Candidatus Paceibacterota bacterium]